MDEVRRPTSSWAIGVAILASALALARCSLVVSTDGLSGGAAGLDGAPAPDGSGAEGGPGAPDAGCGDALAVDPHNCGACGHDCLGGGCAAGRCQPVTLVADASLPGYVALDRDHVYWAAWSADGGVHRAPRDGGPPTPVAAPQPGTFALAVDDANVYFSTAEGVKRTAKGGGPVSFLGAGDSAEIVLDGESVIYSVYTDPANGGVVRSVPKAGGPVTTLTTGLDGAEGMAIDGPRIYVGQEKGVSILEIDRASGAKRAISAQYARRLVLDGDTLFYATFSSPAIWRVPRVGSGSPAQAATWTSASGAGNLVRDGANLCWTASKEPSRVLCAPKTGGAAVEIASGQELVGLAIDERAICWSDKKAGTVSCLAK